MTSNKPINSYYSFLDKHYSFLDEHETPEFILENSDLLVKEDCVILDGWLYERISEDDPVDKYRCFFNCSDYDYLEDEPELEAELDAAFAARV